jgi:nucleoside triphosphate pyrophosphatase
MEDTRNNQVGQSEHSDLTSSPMKSTASTIPLPKLLLASSSPRRSEILRMVEWPFEKVAAEVDESLKEGEGAVAYVERLALAKARDAESRHSSGLILAADTTVVVDERILAKPVDAADARQMLQALQGRWHQVLTGVALVSGETAKVSHEVTDVKFAAMNETEISWYVTTGEPMDKAGAYAIQGKGARFVEEIKGDYFNVMGLPVRLVYELVNKIYRGFSSDAAIGPAGTGSSGPVGTCGGGAVGCVGSPGTCGDAGTGCCDAGTMSRSTRLSLSR